MLSRDQIVLRPVEEKDIPLLYDWFNREESMGNYAAFTAHSYMELLKSYQDSNFWNDNKKYFIIEVKNVPVGEVVLHKALNYRTSGLEIALCIDELEYRGKGYGKSVVNLLRDHIFDNRSDINRIQAVIDIENEPSKKLFKSCNFKYEGTLRGINYHNGKYRDAEVYSLLRHEWMPN